MTPSSARWWLLVAGGIAAMVVASAWAPAQPELFTTGGACQVAQCGTLEDPERWRLAWWLWSFGAVVATAAAAFVLPPEQPSRRDVLLLAVCAVVAVVPMAALAYVASLGTSVHGGVTAAACVPIAGVAVVGSWVRARRAGA